VSAINGSCLVVAHMYIAVLHQLRHRVAVDAVVTSQFLQGPTALVALHQLGLLLLGEVHNSSYLPNRRRCTVVFGQGK
jgi:hypothetical protein